MCMYLAALWRLQVANGSYIDDMAGVNGDIDEASDDSDDDQDLGGFVVEDGSADADDEAPADAGISPAADGRSTAARDAAAKAARVQRDAARNTLFQAVSNLAIAAALSEQSISNIQHSTRACMAETSAVLPLACLAAWGNMALLKRNVAELLSSAGVDRCQPRPTARGTSLSRHVAPPPAAADSSQVRSLSRSNPWCEIRPGLVPACVCMVCSLHG
jgi:hypothetical protein